MSDVITNSSNEIILVKDDRNFEDFTELLEFIYDLYTVRYDDFDNEDDYYEVINTKINGIPVYDRDGDGMYIREIEDWGTGETRAYEVDIDWNNRNVINWIYDNFETDNNYY